MKNRKIMWHLLDHSDFAFSLPFIQIYVLKWTLGEIVKDKKPSKKCQANRLKYIITEYFN